MLCQRHDRFQRGLWARLLGKMPCSKSILPISGQCFNPWPPKIGRFTLVLGRCGVGQVTGRADRTGFSCRIR
jgi:hypothetical protein